MRTRRRADSTPDLFASLPATAEATKRQTAPRDSDEAGDQAGRPRPLLQKDLAGTLTRLTDAEVDSLLAAVTAEAERRGRLAPTSPGGGPAERAGSGDGAASLTTGKLKAVRAAFKAGVKPAAIAQEFGISQSDVRRALAAEGQRAGR